jgi:hypothetical protein
MKKFILLIYFLALSHSIVKAQSCLPGHHSFFYQEEIDNFQADHPGCTKIEGNAKISGNDISNLDGLSVLTSIEGILIIEYNKSLNSLSGLKNLTSVGGGFDIGENDALTDLTGLENLTYIGGSGFGIYNNNALTSLIGLSGLTSLPGNLFIQGNSSLDSLSGLVRLTTIGNGLDIDYNVSLTSLKGLEGLTSIGGQLSITNNLALNSLSGLEGLTSIKYGYFIEDNDSLRNLSGLSGLIDLGGVNEIVGNDALISLKGMSSLTTIPGGLYIGGNSALPDLSGLESVTSIGAMDIADNNSLTSLVGLENIDAGSIYYSSITGNRSLSNCATQCICSYLTNPDGSYEIHDNAQGCNSPEEVKAACASVEIESNSMQDICSISPNPSPGPFLVSLTLKDQTHLKFIVLNSLGQEVKNLINDQLKPGLKQITWDASDIPSGVYYYRIQAGNRAGTGKMILLR